MKQIELTRSLLTDVDERDYEWLSQWKWHASNCARKEYDPKWYAARTERSGGVRKTVYMHREIFARHYGEIPEDQVIDHGDGQSLNNTLENLWLKTHSQNAQNRIIEKRSYKKKRGRRRS